MGSIGEDVQISGRMTVAQNIHSGNNVIADNSLQVNDGTPGAGHFPRVVASTTDPSVFGRVADIGSMCMLSTTGAWFRKTGAGDTAWVPAGGGGSVINPLVLTPAQTPAALAPSTNNYALPNTTSVARQATDAGGSTVTGLVAQTDGFVFFVENLGPSTLTLIHESASSTAANRFNLSSNSNVTLQIGDTLGVIYDIASARWRELSSTVSTTARITNVALGNSPYTILPNDADLFVDTSAGPVTLTLPNPTQFGFGKVYLVVDTKGTFATNICTLQPNGGEKISGLAAAKPLQTAWGSFRIVTDGVDWYVT